jgi:Family of unknown function (DUF6502)
MVGAMPKDSRSVWNSGLQRAALVGLGGFLRPLARFLLKSGIRYREFADIAKAAFISVAADDYGVRGRPASLSRVAAVTGIGRKEVSRIHKSDLAQLEARFWASQLNPLTQVLHFWHSDPEYSVDGVPRLLGFLEGEHSFADLVSRYAGNIPPSVARAELERCGAIEETADGCLRAVRRQYTPNEVDVEFVRSMIFSLKNLAGTLAHNADVISREGPATVNGRLERYAWTSSLSEASRREFRILAERKAEELLLYLDAWIGEREQLELGQATTSDPEQKKTCGLGVYHFEDTGDGEESGAGRGSFSAKN